MNLRDFVHLTLRMFRDNCRLFLHILIVRSRRKSCIENKCHFLVVKQPIYAKLSMYAIASLLYFNPQFEIVIHCDDKCKKSVLWRCRLLLGSRCNINLIGGVVTDPMRNKALLLLTLQGTDDIFVDADTRFNGKLPRLSQITTLVKEFRMDEKPIWIRICRDIGIDSGKVEMLNTSFFSWSGHTLDLNYVTFQDFYDKFSSVHWTDISMEYSIESQSLQRLVEQVFFSIVLSGNKTNALKNFDTVADKGVIESTYFGASGYRFGR